MQGDNNQGGVTISAGNSPLLRLNNDVSSNSLAKKVKKKQVLARDSNSNFKKSQAQFSKSVMKQVGTQMSQTHDKI